MYATVGKKYISTEVLQENGLAFGEVGQSVGFKNGDKIVSVDGKFQENFNRMTMDILFSSEVKVDRNGEIVALNLTDEQIGEIISKEGRNFVAARTIGSVIDSVAPKSNAEQAGLRKGDSIVAINGKTPRYFDEFTEVVKANKKGTISLVILRDNALDTITSRVSEEGTIGITVPQKIKDDFLVTNKMSISEAIPAAVKESWSMIVYNVKSFKLILRPSTGAYKQVKSPVGIARQLPDEWNWEFIWNFTALFSIGLAFMNLLPIPGLDGGHALFTIAEMITGKTLNDKAAGYVQTAGMIILLTLMALTFGKDIIELVIDKLF